jgi:hypothetical protein
MKMFLGYPFGPNNPSKSIKTGAKKQQQVSKEGTSCNSLCSLKIVVPDG